MIVYLISYWVLVISYFKPVIPIPVFSTEIKTEDLLPNSVIEDCLAKLKVAFEEKKLYLDPELTLQSLAAEINIPARTISTVLNSTMQKNFRDYINSYRVEEAKRLLEDYRERNLTIAAVAYDAGFNSLATFQRVFKKMTGKTPKEFT
ncbi:helix-turn-helix domain-containing protein [Chryseobacterium sp. Mn2064]|uniref:helix-turn-helix domain-containing protein n=1 Tax=Chryseobacterium sp. Mn2064 TaxID=3395263 RepID=UPI003BC9CFD1